MKDHIEKLIDIAIDNLKYSYAPYSNFNVSAVLETDTGEIFTGVNIENASYTPTNCAERTAIFKAVSEGYRRFKRIVILGGANFSFDEYISPCGVCRQVMAEFDLNNDLEIILAKSNKEYIKKDLKSLFPMSFGPNNLR